MLRNGQFYAIHTDHLGTPRIMTNADAKPVWQWPYSAFGNNKPSGVLQATTNPKAAITNQPMLLKATNPQQALDLRFPGQYFDVETQMADNINRLYWQLHGRYSQSDPIGLAGGVNTFAYVGGNPLTRWDPSGLLFDELGTYTAPVAATAAAATSPVWIPAAGATIILVGAYSAIAPERCEYDDDKCRKILAEIYKTLRQINGRIDDMLADQHRLYDFAYDKPLEVGPLAGKGTWTGHYQQADGKQNHLRKLIVEALKYKCKVPKEAWDAAFRKIPLVPRRHG